MVNHPNSPPASPWIGSTIKAAILSPSFSNSASSSGKLLYLTLEKPGINGPKPLYAVGSLDDEIAASVLPQKLLPANNTRALFSGMPFTSYPHLRASLIAVSPPSTLY